ncbi:putative cytochrome P450 [Rosellinia necatrix]|uniref:Putative cytochrome P450 n=1 Tax=Rosellinia necatrix TaxID=77044 RepID=A0A1W2TRD4_ROSNE|nr:putative cytochrome P450 [Rosellinia necatrix]
MHSDEEKICGIKEVYRPADDDAEIDIVAVHGLNGDALRTWTSRKNGVCWLYHPDFLPRYVRNARVLVWGYNSSFGTLTGVEPSENRIHHHAQTLVAQLYADRKLENMTEKPIIFLCHSLGGLVVKRALSYAHSRSSDKLAHLHTIFTCTYGMLFFGTPHHGSSKASLLLMLQRLTSLAVPGRFGRVEKGLVKALEEESETLQNITDYFTPLMKDFHIHFFWEQERTDLKYTKDYIVGKESAAPAFDDTERSGIHADHSGMVKFEDSASSGFRLVAATLDRYCTEAPEAISQRQGGSALRVPGNAQGDAPKARILMIHSPPYMPSLVSDPSAFPRQDQASII